MSADLNIVSFTLYTVEGKMTKFGVHIPWVKPFLVSSKYWPASPCYLDPVIAEDVAVVYEFLKHILHFLSRNSDYDDNNNDIFPEELFLLLTARCCVSASLSPLSS